MSDASRTDDAGDATTLRPVPSFDALFVDEYPRMVALAAAVSGSRLFAEDLAQEAMWRLDRNWRRVAGMDAPGAWVRRVTINLALSHRRRVATEIKAKLRLGGPEPTLPPALEDNEPVWAAVATLPGKQRAAIALHYLEDRPVDEIADILDISPSTARVHLHRGREALRDRLSDFDPAIFDNADNNEQAPR
jgi:RNA polymerase sigma factor (sigma-70 family)